MLLTGRGDRSDFSSGEMGVQRNSALSYTRAINGGPGTPSGHCAFLSTIRPRQRCHRAVALGVPGWGKGAEQPSPACPSLFVASAPPPARATPAVHPGPALGPAAARTGGSHTMCLFSLGCVTSVRSGPGLIPGFRGVLMALAAPDSEGARALPPGMLGWTTGSGPGLSEGTNRPGSANRHA